MTEAETLAKLICDATLAWHESEDENGTDGALSYFIATKILSSGFGKTEALREALKPFAKIEVPPEAEAGTWVARTLHCGDQVTAHSVWRAREALGRHKDTQHGP